MRNELFHPLPKPLILLNVKNFLFTILGVTLALPTLAQQTVHWTNADRKYLIENLTRTRDSIINETKNLSPAQWNFKESPDRWSINQIIEHLAIWELLLDREINQALVAGERPEIADVKKTDSSVLAFLMQEEPHIATEYTKPFTFTVPLGLNEGNNNLTWFLKMRNEGIGFCDSTSSNLRSYFLRPGRGNVHQVFITIFGHTDRHLRQIRRVKLHSNYPKK
jgi:hypothetical protein